jgi:CheY-like chemotaxis protein/MinD-like ATPase involved in chromosome partitioning or flagellar assembly
MAEKILIVDDDVDTLRLVGLMLQRQGYQISAATNGQQGLSKAVDEQPDLILLDIMMPNMDGYEVTRQLRQNPITANTPILMFTAKTQLDDKVAGFEVGADDYLTKPTHPSELQAHVKALLARSGQRETKEKTSAQTQHAHVIGVLAVRGGLGVSTVAMNLATGLYTRSQSDVALAEMVPGKGTLGLDLGLTSQKALVKFLSGPPSEVTRERVKNALVPHISGVKLLLASDHPSDVHLTSQVAQYEALLEKLALLSRYLVLDLDNGLPPFTQKLLPACNDIVIVMEGIPNTILHTKSLIEDLTKLGVKKERISVVLNNRIRSDTQLPASVVQDKLGNPITVTLTPAPELLTQATRMQTAAILCQPDGVTAKQIFKLADHLIQNETAEK